MMLSGTGNPRHVHRLNILESGAKDLKGLVHLLFRNNQRGRLNKNVSIREVTPQAGNRPHTRRMMLR